MDNQIKTAQLKLLQDLYSELSDYDPDIPVSIQAMKEWLQQKISEVTGV